MSMAAACSSSNDDGATSGSAGAAGTGSTSSDDPFAALRSSVAGGQQVACDGDRCCFNQCGGTQVLCASRAQSDLKELDPWKSCSEVTLPSWVASNDCWIWTKDSSSGWPTLQCFCSISGGSYTGEYSSSGITWADGCDQSAVTADSTYGIPYERACSDSCSGGSGGSSGAGGSSGSGGGGTVDPCGSCLSDCQGLSSCCTGCGCLCEAECGQCF